MSNEGLEEIVERLDYNEAYGFSEKNVQYEEFEKGLSENVVRKISAMKNEPEWMLQKRLTGYKIFESKPMPKWGADLSKIDFSDFYYYVKPKGKESSRWEDVPEDIKNTFDKLGVPEAERKFFSGAEAQFDSGVVYSHINEELDKLGIIFTDTDNAVKKYPELMQKYFGTIIPPTDNKFAALNTATWSGGTFIYVPKGVKVPMPLNAYFRINAQKSGQFERTLIIADEGSDVTYIEGCLPADELVSKGYSFEQISVIKDHDSVVSHTGKLREVNRTFVHKFKGLMYKVIPQSGFNGFRVTGEHPVLCVKRKKVLAKRGQRGLWKPEVSTAELLGAIPEFVSASQLEEGDFIVYVAPEGVEEDKFITDDHLKILGLYLAEGSISKNKALNNRKSVAFSFGMSDKERDIAEELHRLLIASGYKGSVCKAKNKYYVVSSYSKDLIELCGANCGTGASTKKLSEKIMKLSPERQKVLLDYYWKGDGNVYVRNGKSLMRASTASKELAFQIQEILARNGIFANLNLRKGSDDFINGRKITRKDQVIVEYTKNTSMGEVRKKANSFFVPIKKIESEMFDGQVYNFAVDSDESYLVRGFAVHNCTAPVYAVDSLHSAVVEMVAMKGAHIRYVTIQNWSKNVYNLVTQRAHAEKDARVEWIDANIGSKVNMKYPSIFLKGDGAKGEVLSIAIAGEGQVQDSGGKIIHIAPNTTSKIISKSVSKGSGVSTFRGQIRVMKSAANVKSHVSCDALLLDSEAKTNTFPYNNIERNDAMISHEAKVGKISNDEIFYLMSRGVSEDDAVAMIVLGFLDDLTKVLPMEYSLELKRLIKLDTSKGVG